MNDSDDQYEDYHDDQAPGVTKILDLTNGEGGELPPSSAQPLDPHHHFHHIDHHNHRPPAEDADMDDDEEDEEDEEIAMARAATETPSRGGSSKSGSTGGGGAASGGKMSINPNTPGKVVESGQEQTGRWTKQEHEAFLEALRMYGKEWKKVAAKVKTRTVVQTRTHAQKYFQKLQKAQETAGSSAEIDYVDMGISGEGREPSSSGKGRGASSSTKKKPRNQQPQSAASSSTATAVLSVSKSNRRSSNATLSAAQMITNLSSAGTGGASGTQAFVAGSNRAARPHGFSTDDSPAIATSTTAFVSTATTSGASAAAAGWVPTMKIVAPDPMSTIKKGKFPEPSPAATGKRKLAEIAAARMLAGVGAGVVPSSAETLQDVAATSVKADDMDDRDGAATPPPDFGGGSSLSLKDAPPPPLFAGSSSADGAARKGLALQIVNPESFGVTEKRRKVGGGEGSPVTPWDGQLEALVNEKAKTDSAQKSSDQDDSPAVAETENCSSEEPSQHPVCGPGTAFGRSRLHCVVCEMDIESLQTQLGEIPNQSAGVLGRLDNAGYAPLHTAASLRLTRSEFSVAALEIVRTLLAAGADPNVHDDEGNSPLHWAARAGDRDVAEALLVRNSQLDSKNKHGETPLHWGMRAGRAGVSVVSLLVDNGARISSLNAKFRRPIDVAAEGFLDTKSSVASLKIRDQNEKKMSRELKKSLKEKLPEIRETRLGLFNRSGPSRTLVLHHPECLEHVPKSQSDWEAPDRVVSIMTRVSQNNPTGGDEEIRDQEITLSSEFERANLDLLSRVHSTDYLHFVQNLSKDLEKQVKASAEVGDEGDGKEASPPVVPFTPMVQRTMIKVSESDVKSIANSDTAFSAGSLRAARRAAGAVQHAVDCVLVGRNRNSFCVVRPPGHHAGVSGLLTGGESCGFCIFNNVAAGALYAISDERLLCERCAIVDLDVHHGNGTEEIVRKCHDPSKLFFFSIHLYDNDKRKRGPNQFHYKFYPGTGSEDDLAMNIINVPIIPLWKDQTVPSPPVTRTHNTRQKTRSGDQDEESPVGTPRGGRNSDAGSESGSTNVSPRHAAKPGLGSGRLAYRDAIQNRLLPALRAFNPDLILISAGFDAAKGDVGNARHERGGRERIGLDLEPEDYAWTTRKILEIADICCNGRVVSVLEGGYGRSPLNQPPDDGSPRKPLDRTIFSECAVRHLHALIDPYDVEHRFTSVH